MSDDAHELKGPHFVLSAEGDLLGEDTEHNRTLVRRIHACVNACDGITTEELEKGIIADMRRVIAQVAPLLEQQVRQAPPAPKTIVVHGEPTSTRPSSRNSDASLPSKTT